MSDPAAPTPPRDPSVEKRGILSAEEIRARRDIQGAIEDAERALDCLPAYAAGRAGIEAAVREMRGDADQAPGASAPSSPEAERRYFFIFR